MNLLNFAVGGIAGGLSAAPLAPAAGGGALLAGALSGSTGNAAAGNRDGLVSALPDILASVNGLAQAAATSPDPSELLTLPPLLPMPAPAKAPEPPQDDNGQSNIVMQDSSSDGALIH